MNQIFLILVVSLGVGGAIGWLTMRFWLARHPHKIGVKTMDLDLNDSRYVINEQAGRAGFLAKNLDGVGWYEAGFVELPPVAHQCWTQSWAEMKDLSFVRRCPCGAISLNDRDNGDVFWMERNSTRASRERKP